MDNLPSVHHHTISQLLTALGAENKEKDFYVFKRSPELQKIPVKYPFKSDFFSILLVTQGEVCLKLNLLDYTIKKNELLFISPNDLRQFQHVTNDSSFFGIGFTSDFLTTTGIHKKNIDAFDFFSSQASPLLKLEEADAEMLTQLLAILHIKSNIQKNSFFSIEVITYSFSALIFEIASIYRKTNPFYTKITRKEDLVIRFMKLLPKHIREERGLKYYADLLFVTPKYLTQTVKEITGKTAGQFIDEMVIMEAKVLLNDFSKSIGQVAQELNFSDQFFFSKFFKKHTQHTPSDYRSVL